MPKLWVGADLHLDHLNRLDYTAFKGSLMAKQPPEAILIAGDIGLGGQALGYLLDIQRAVDVPIYFVLGNHDFYCGAYVADGYIRNCAETVHAPVHYLFDRPYKLFDKTYVVGVDGIGDCGYGAPLSSEAWGMLNDFNWIHELRHDLTREERVEYLQERGRIQARRLKSSVHSCASMADRIIVLTHVPPFPQSCIHRGKQSSPSWLPFFASMYMGDTLIELARLYPDIQFHVYCGHTHEFARYEPTNNLIVHTLGAEYEHPKFEVVKY